MDAGDFQRLDLGVFGAGFARDLDCGIARFTEIAGFGEGVDGFLDGGFVSGSKSYRAGCLITYGVRSGNTGDSFVHAFDAFIAAEVNVAESDGAISGADRNQQGAKNRGEQ